MPSKQFDVQGIGIVTLSKRKGVRFLRIRLDADGAIRVTLPKWVPYKMGVDFVQSRKNWILENRVPSPELYNGKKIGKHHTLHIAPQPVFGAPKVRVSRNMVLVTMHHDSSLEDPFLQEKISKGITRALRREASELLPLRVEELARLHGYTYSSVSIKQLKSRWGSCSSKKEIVLNLYLMQLPWELIDYVILHELAHTRVLAHGKPFWDEMGKSLVNVKVLRKQIKGYRAGIF